MGIGVRFVSILLLLDDRNSSSIVEAVTLLVKYIGIGHRIDPSSSSEALSMCDGCSCSVALS